MPGEVLSEERTTEPTPLDRIAINVKAYRLLEELLQENPRLEEIMRGAKNEVEALVDRIDVETDIQGGEAVAFDVAFSGNGSVTPHGVVDSLA